MPETLAQTTARITSFITEEAPTIDVSPGSVFNELIIGTESQIQNQEFNDVSDVSAGNSITAALASLDDTYSPVIDAIASNYGVSRTQGAYTTGIIQVTVSTFQNYYIPTNIVFVQPALNYSYAVSSATTISSGSLNAVSASGPWTFTIPVQALVTGQQQTVSNGTQFTLQTTGAIPQFVSAVAVGSFIAGLNVETDKELIARFRTGLSVKNLLTTASVTNSLDTLYPNFTTAYLADIYSPVNIRSTSNLLGIKNPGTVDVYIKNNITIPQVTFSIVGISNVVDGVTRPNEWIVNIPASAAPGFYRVLNIQEADPASTSISYLPFTVTYGVATLHKNLIPNSACARFSVYQTAKAIVTTPSVLANSLDSIPAPTPNFLVTVVAPVSLQDIQNLFLDDNNRIPGSDYLVKGIVPCQVSLSLSLIKNNSTDVIDTVSLQGDIFNYINGLGTGESIAVSKIVSLCHNYNIARVDLPIVLTGKILAPYSDSSLESVIDADITIRGTDFLTIPDLSANGVITENTMFFISYFDDNGNQNINITVN